MDIPEKDYIFVIYTCKKNLEKANQMYNCFCEIMESTISIKLLIMYGDVIHTDYEIKDNKYLVINVDDGYEFLYLKSLQLFKIINNIFPKIKGCFKCDDDIVLNLFSLGKFIETLKYFSIDYSGVVITSIENNNNNIHLINKNINKNVNTPSAIYCGGPLYYLGKKSLDIIENIIIKDVEHIFYEDLMIGYILNKNNIYPIHSNLYNNDVLLYNTLMYNCCSYHNTKHNNILFIRIRGGLGNQMFQIASGYGIAKKNNMDCIIINSSNVLKNDFTHTKDNNFFMNIIFNAFPTVNLECINLKQLKYYKEESKDCFIFNDFILKEDFLFDGYFQNEKYFIDYKNIIVEKFKDNNLYKNLLNNIKNNKEHELLLKTSYFLHVRRGDYVNNPTHQIDYDTYYSKAISYILEKDKNANFVIISDDIEYCKTYRVFNNINKVFFNNSSPLETIYFMSFFYKGGICCNSTFSWWGSYLNNNRNKLVLFPSKWINNEWSVDIYYENSTIIKI
jgi:hypothetical protein